MRGISEETIKEILADKAEYKMSKPYINAQEKLLKALIDHCCEELNPWVPLETFLESNYKGQCWVIYKGSVEITLCMHGVFHLVQPDGIVCLSTNNITHVMPIPKPTPPNVSDKGV